MYIFFFFRGQQSSGGIKPWYGFKLMPFVEKKKEWDDVTPIEHAKAGRPANIVWGGFWRKTFGNKHSTSGILHTCITKHRSVCLILFPSDLCR